VFVKMCPLINKSVVVNCQLELKPKVERLAYVCGQHIILRCIGMEHRQIMRNKLRKMGVQNITLGL